VLQPRFRVTSELVLLLAVLDVLDVLHVLFVFLFGVPEPFVDLVLSQIKLVVEHDNLFATRIAITVRIYFQ